MRVALVHDYLTQYGGAERVLEVLHERYPDAPVYTSLYDPNHLPDSFKSWDIRVSMLGSIPGSARTHRLWAPLYPAIFGHVGFHAIKDVDIVIADTSAWAHHTRPRHDVPVIGYCHSPARFLYGDPNYLGAARIPAPLRPASSGLFTALRWLDRRAAERLAHVVANSGAVRERILNDWGVDSTVIHPPVNIDRFRPAEPVDAEDWYLVVSRLVPHKWIDRAVRACTIANKRLKVIGSGRSEHALRRIAGPTIEFLGERSDAYVVDHMQRCRALILPGIEDFGMTSIEAQAAGRPVIAARGGGALETVIENVTGLLFEPRNDDELVGLLHHEQTWDSGVIQQHTRQFGTDVFLEKMNTVVQDVLCEAARP
ncbi:MAG TPA: glycosyltransferase [Thermomicrobiales bacterium]|nr:glycosyltransferase [Thermomicrobiales bacterium]